MSTHSPNADVLGAMARRRKSATDTPEREKRSPSLSRVDPTDAPQITGGYFSKAIQSVLETLAPAEETENASFELQLLESAIEQARDAIVICSAPSSSAPPVVSYTNQSFATFTGMPRHEMEDKILFDLPGWTLEQGGRRRVFNAMLESKAFEGELAGNRPHGAEYMVEVRFNPILKNGECTHFIGIIRDVTERKRVERELVHNAHHDALTGLPNRKLFRDRLGQALRRAERYQDGIALLYIDLDGFKPINDSLGHSMGDLVLQVVSERLLEVVRASDTVARLGGDEFVVLLPSCAEADHAIRVAEKLIESVTQVIAGQGKEVFITPSIGVAHFAKEAPAADDLIKYADTAMYQAKSQGKARYVLFTKELMGARQTQDIMTDELASAMSLNEFQLHFRPVLDTKAEQNCGAEPMLRWLHPQRGMVSPARFLPLLQKLPVEEQVAHWMLEESCRRATAWRDSTELYFTAFKSQLSDPNLAEHLLSTLNHTKLAPNRLVFQIPESHLTEMPETSLFQLVKLQSYGVRIVICEYGSSNLSLPQIRNLPINGLKIDPTLTAKLETNGQLVRGVAALSKSLGLTVMADGVTSGRQLAALTKLGCQKCQGSHVGTPKPNTIP